MVPRRVLFTPLAHDAISQSPRVSDIDNDIVPSGADAQGGRSLVCVTRPALIHPAIESCAGCRGRIGARAHHCGDGSAPCGVAGLLCAVTARFAVVVCR